MNRFRDLMSFCWLSALLLANSNAAIGQAIRAGVAKVDITNTQAGPVNDPLYAKAIVIASADTTMVLVSVDAVATGEIGYIYYCLTAEQLRNLGGAQEDNDCILDPVWQEKLESLAIQTLRGF